MIKYLIKNYYKNIIFIIIFSATSAYLSLLLPDILKDIIISLGELNKSVLYNLGLKLIIISIFIFIISNISNYFSNKLGAKIGNDLRTKLYSATLNLDLDNVNNFGVSSLIVRNTSDINQIETMISILSKTLIYTLILGIGGSYKIIISSYNLPILTLIVIFCILLTCIFLYIVFVTVIPKYNLLQTNLDKINERFQEILNGLLVIKAENQEHFEYKKSEKYNNTYVNLEYFLNKVMSMLSPFVTLILNLSTISIVFIMFKFAFDLNEIANMIAYSEYATRVISSFLSLSLCFIMLPKAKISFTRIMEVINSYNNIYDNNNAKEIIDVEKLRIKNVSFNYPNSNELSLKNINLTIEKGETIAVIGSTGAGKTTLVNLLNRFYDVSNGEILINDIDIRNIKLVNIRNLIATVFQNEFIMRGELTEILCNKDKRKIEEILSTVSYQDLDITKKISFNADNFSGGQKQRLCIARALLKNPQILILDDAFSAIDYTTEKIILNNIKKEFKDTIKIIITSRTSSIKYADKILVLDNGKIVGFDNHKELLKNCLIYKKIYNLANNPEDNHE